MTALAPVDGDAMLLGSESPLARTYDVALLDLDGVCFAGDARVDYAADSINGARAHGMTLSFVTNNASRAPQAVVDKLSRNDIRASPDEVFSAAMDAAALLRERLAEGSPVLVVGGEGLLLPPRASRLSPRPTTGPPLSFRAGIRPSTGR